MNSSSDDVVVGGLQVEASDEYFCVAATTNLPFWETFFQLFPHFFSLKSGGVQVELSDEYFCVAATTNLPFWENTL